MAEQVPVAGYYRVSVAREGMKAPQLYEDEIVRYCRYRRLELAETFSDLDRSAFRGARPRPGLEALVARRAEFSAIVIPKLSRFGRSMKELIGLFDLFDSDSIPLVFLDMNLDTSTSQGRLLRHILAAFAEYESDVRSDYSKATIESRARRGLPHGAWVAYGYRRGEHGYELAHPECDIVEAIFSFYATGETMTGIARLLNDAGLPSPRGVHWAKATIRVMLENHHYIARLRHQGRLRKGAWPPIVSGDLWDAVHARLQTITNRGINRPQQGLYLLSSLIECGFCACTLHHRTKQDRSPGQYLCRGPDRNGWCHGGGIAEHRAEAMVVDALLERYGDSLVHAPDLSTAPLPMSVFWARADLGARRTMLSAAIECLVLIPRPADNRRGMGLPRGRRLAITWATTEDPQGRDVVLSVEPIHAGASKTCKGCGRRKHIANFLRDPSVPGGRIDLCPRCRPRPAPTVTVDDDAVAPPRTSYQREWRAFQQRFRDGWDEPSARSG